MNGLDNLIRSSLQENADISQSDVENSLLSFKLKIKADNINKKKNTWFYRINLGKASLIAACSLLIATFVLVTASSNVRAVALEAINSVKMLFVTQKSGDAIEIVQKPSSEVYGQPYSYIITDKSDAEISNLVNFPIILPEILDESYELKNRFITIGLEKEIPYDKIETLSIQLKNAIEDQKEFDKLSPYSPFRGVMCNYEYTAPDKAYGADFGLIMTPLQPADLSNTEEVKIGDIPGYWKTIKYPEYPWTPKGEDPMTYKPTIRDDAKSLYWSLNGITYSLHILHETNLTYITKDLAIELAKEFIAAQKK